MKYKMLDVVVLERNLPEHRLRRGDCGTIVEIYEPDGIEVEFLEPSGYTRAVVTLDVADARLASNEDLANRSKLRDEPDHPRR
jgi:hypothetical protein